MYKKSNEIKKNKKLTKSRWQMSLVFNIFLNALKSSFVRIEK